MTREVVISDLIQRVDKLEREIEGKSLRIAWLEEQLREFHSMFNNYVRINDRDKLATRNRIDGIEFSQARREHG